MFRSPAIIRELVLSLAKVILKHSVKLCPYRLRGGVAACLGVECVLCAVLCCAELAQCEYYTTRTYANFLISYYQ
jgi:hypothetical protein